MEQAIARRLFLTEEGTAQLHLQELVCSMYAPLTHFIQNSELLRRRSNLLRQFIPRLFPRGSFLPLLDSFLLDRERPIMPVFQASLADALSRRPIDDHDDLPDLAEAPSSS